MQRSSILGNLQQEPHVVLGDVPLFSNPSKERHQEHINGGLGKFPANPSTYHSPPSSPGDRGRWGTLPLGTDDNSNNTSDSRPEGYYTYDVEPKVSDRIERVAFWTADFVAIEGSARQKRVLEQIKKVHEYAQRGLERHRKYINELLGPSLTRAFAEIPQRVLDSQQFSRLKTQIEDQQEKIENLEADLANKGDEIVALKARLQALEETVLALQNPN